MIKSWSANQRRKEIVQDKDWLTLPGWACAVTKARPTHLIKPEPIHPMRHLLRPTTLIPAIAGFLLGLVANILPDYLTAGGRSILIALFVLTLVFGLAAVW